MQKKIEELVENTGIWPLAAGATLAFIAGTACYICAFKRVAISEKRFEGGTFIYINWQGNVRSIYQPFKRIMAAVKQMHEALKDVAP